MENACGQIRKLQLDSELDRGRGWGRGRGSDTHFSTDFIPMVTRCALQALRDQNYILSNHLNGEV